MNKFVLIIGGLLLLGIGFYAYKGMKTSNTETSMAVTDNSKSHAESMTDSYPPSETKMMPSSSEIVVEAANFKFSVPEIKVKKGETVKIKFENKEGFHDFVLDEFNIKTKQLKATESESVEFIADKAGTFEYYCSIGSHRQMGMVGKLIVE